MMTSYHTTVMLREVMDALQREPRKKYIDATVGGGGHGWEIIKRGGVLLGIDQDPEAVEFAKQNLKLGHKVWEIVHGNFRDIKRIAIENDFSEVDGILFDLGVSSHQLDTPERGFSYRFGNATLDMRLDQSKGITARELLQSANEETLYEIFAKLGEEEHSRAIAHALVRARQVKEIATAQQLLLILENVIRDKKIVPATASRVFQALRIAVNDELSAVRDGLLGAIDLLRHGGRIVAISFHSLEDRMVKQTFRASALRIITKNPIVPSETECETNKRARSAKLRVGEKL